MHILNVLVRDVDGFDRQILQAVVSALALAVIVVWQHRMHQSLQRGMTDDHEIQASSHLNVEIRVETGPYIVH